MKKFALSSLLLALTFLHQVNGQLANTDQANNDFLRFNQTTGAFEGSFVSGENTYRPFQATTTTVSSESNRYLVSDTSKVCPNRNEILVRRTPRENPPRKSCR